MSKTGSSKTRTSDHAAGKADTDPGINPAFEEMMRAFDPGQFMKPFDPATLADTYAQLASEYKIPLSAVDALLDNQKKNITALTRANQEMAAGVRSVIEHQDRVLSEMLDKTTRSYNEIIQSGDPRETAANQLNLIQKSYEKSLEDIGKMAAIMTQSQEKIAHILAERISENLDTMKKK